MKGANSVDTSRQIRLFSNAENSYPVQLGLQLRCGEAVWRLSATVSPAYRVVGLRERRRGENV